MYFFWPCTTIFTSYFACTLTLIFCSSSALFSTFFPKIFFSRVRHLSHSDLCPAHTHTQMQIPPPKQALEEGAESVRTLSAFSISGCGFGGGREGKIDLPPNSPKPCLLWFWVFGGKKIGCSNVDHFVVHPQNPPPEFSAAVREFWEIE